jgi:EmrB/QacA subfamily drug resistance transporter
VLLVSSFGAFLAFLDATVVNIAFPDMRASFPDATISGLSWVLNAYNIVFAAFLIVFGRFADLLGRRRVFAAGIVVFTVASLGCAAAPTLDLLVAARVVQALGAAMLVPASLAIVVEAFDGGHRAHAVGLWGAAGAVAAGLGPPVGGALVEIGGWRLAFLVNLPFGVAAALLARRSLVESRSPGRRRMPDLRGSLLIAVSLSLLTLGIVQGSDWGWSSLRVLGAFAGAAVAGAGFVASSRAHPQPLLDPVLLRIRPFTVANAVTVLAGMGFYAYMLTNILWLQYVWGYSILVAGLALVPGALVAAVVAAALGPVAQQHGFRRVVVPGAVVWSAAYLWYALVVGVEPAFWAQWLPGQVLSGIGVGATLPVLGSAALAAVPGGRYATASAVLSSTRQLGGVLGIAVLVVIIGTPTASNAAAVLEDGWLLSALCFAIAAVGVLFLSGFGAVPQSEELALRAGAVQVPESRAGELTPETLAPQRHENYLARLPAAVRAQLEAAGSARDLVAGEWLFRTGDQADAMFVLLGGRLEVVQAGAVIRELGPGAILGELALLTGGTRSAGVRARRDSVLLRVSRDQFQEAITRDAEAPLAVAAALAEDLQHPRSVDEPASGQPSVVAVLGLTRSAPVAAVRTELVAGLGRRLRVVSVGELDPESLARAEQDGDRVVLSAELDEHGAVTEWWSSALRQSDRAVLVARSADEPPGSWDGPSGPELVLVGGRPDEATIARWSSVLRPWQVTVAEESDLRAGLRPLVDRIAGQSLGLVLAGGGARALSHIGVLYELEAAGIRVGRVAGASLGAIVAGLCAVGHDAATVEAICYEEFVRRRPFSDYTLPITGLAKGRRKDQALRRQLGVDTLIEALPRQLRCVSTDLFERERVVHRSGVLWQAVAASARLPVLFPPVRLDGRVLVDGGVLDNLPVGALTERDEGPLIAVNIGMAQPSGGGVRRPVRTPALGETLLRTMMIGSAGAGEQARAAGAYVVAPASMGVGMLEFHQIDTMIAAGRLATRALLDEVGDALTVPPGPPGPSGPPRTEWTGGTSPTLTSQA